MLESVRQLEAALARATHEREHDWRRNVLSMLRDLQAGLRRHAEELAGDEGLMGDIVRETPRLSGRVERLREQHRELVQEIEGLRHDFDTEQHARLKPNITDIRSRVEKLIANLRNFQAIETDLIFEATQVDIGVGD